MCMDLPFRNVGAQFRVLGLEPTVTQVGVVNIAILH